MRDEQWPLKEFARHQRSHLSKGEVKLWTRLRGKALGHRFRRQHTIGRYIVDFACLERRLIVEVDGSQHGDLENDHARDEYLRERGFRVLRFTAWAALECTGRVIDEIQAALLGKDLPIGDPDEVLERSRRGF